MLPKFLVLWTFLLNWASCAVILNSHLLTRDIGPTAPLSLSSSSASSDDDKHPPNPPTTSIIDILSSTPEFSKFIVSLQRSGLIDTVNNLENVTLLAPLNQAFGDNADYVRITKDDLFQFIVDEPLLSSQIVGVQILRTLYNGASPFLKKLPLPILCDNRDGLFMIENANVVETDLIAGTSNSVVYGLDTIIEEKQSICEILSRPYEEIPHDKDVKVFTSLMSHNDFCVRNQFTNLTVLLPLDSALSFNDIEMDYLYTDLGEDDRLKLVSNYLISVVWW
ncbi:unnamed protein product [Ambrosiozyma monospora]|uniref:Unnamed protein product n=1 Tax=Ambrosiozyma monospora TaxID=43982 RepID=A0ACB5TA58_AMBMO|nr:unnamed protein product [Ambrosiozyma monospora]